MRQSVKLLLLLYINAHHSDYKENIYDCPRLGARPCCVYYVIRRKNISSHGLSYNLDAEKYTLRQLVKTSTSYVALS